MPKKSGTPSPSLQKSYWERFLRSMNLVGPIMEEAQQTETAYKQAPPPSQVEPEIQTFINRVAERLIPIADDYDFETKRKLQTVRERYRRELTNVFDGKESIEKWFNRTRGNLGIHQIDMTKILYECLEGLRSPEAKELRMQYGQALQRVSSMYQPML